MVVTVPGLVAFVLMLVIAGYESRSETATVFTLETFDIVSRSSGPAVEAVPA